MWSRGAVEVLTGIGEGRALRTGRLLIRPLRSSDQQAFISLGERVRGTLASSMPLHHPGETGGAMFMRQLGLAQAGDGDGTAWRRVICLDEGRDAGRIIGGVNLIAIRRGFEADADLNFWVAPSFTGLGIATEAVEAVLTHALAEPPAGMGLRTVHAAVQPGNAASHALLRKLGAKAACRLESLHVGGCWRPHEMYSMFASSHDDSEITQTRGTERDTRTTASI